MASTFRAAVVRTPSGPEAIEIIDVPVVDPGPGEVRVSVAGAAVNPVDLAVASGFFHRLGLIDQPHHTGLGWDFAGVVSASGPGVDLRVGSRVAGLVAGFDRDWGTYAEQVVVPARDVALVPDGLDLTTAAAVPLNALAAAQAIDLLGPADGQRVLVTGAAGALGANAIVLARAQGWRVTGLARAEDEPFVRGLGAEFAEALTPGWDAVVDGAALAGEAFAVVREGGQYVGVKPGGAPSPERGVTVAVIETTPDGGRLAGLLDAVADGRLPARVHAVLPLDRAGDAHRAVAKGGVRGKYVLEP